MIKLNQTKLTEPEQLHLEDFITQVATTRNVSRLQAIYIIQTQLEKGKDE
jgi:hypothetical protein